MKKIFIVGSKGIPARYGGFETFVDELVTRKRDGSISYFVACMGKGKRVKYNDADCFFVDVPSIGPAKAILYDIRALKEVIKMTKEEGCNDGIVYVLACRIGPFFRHYVKKLHRIGLKVFVNPDGNEWKRAKWGFFTRKYWKLSEKLMVKSADLLVCDSKSIEKYIKKEYSKYNPKTTFIAYGADEVKSKLKNDSEKLVNWYDSFGLKGKDYYVVVGRFVPENNLEVIIREFMRSDTKKKLVVITNVEKNKYYYDLKKKTGFDQDERIIFAGTVYDKDLIKKIREEAFAYFHGHSVGGTNPSLLEALASTDINVLFDCCFNREVAGESAMYFNKSKGDLAKKISEIENMTKKQIGELSQKAKNQIALNYKWDKIVDKYEELWTKN